MPGPTSLGSHLFLGKGKRKGLCGVEKPQYLGREKGADGQMGVCVPVWNVKCRSALLGWNIKKWFRIGGRLRWLQILPQALTAIASEGTGVDCVSFEKLSDLFGPLFSNFKWV